MLSKGWHLTCLGVGALVVSMSQARADDTTIRMGGKGSIQDAGANLSRLDLRPQVNDDDDTVSVGYRYKYGYGRGFYGGGFYGGFYRGYPSFYGGYRSFYSYPRYSFGFNYYQPRYYGGFGFSNFYGGYRSFYVSPFYYGGFGHISGSILIDQPPPSTLQITPISPLNPVTPMNPNLGDPVLPNPRLPVPQNPNDGFRYDGGPANPVPLPQGSPEPKAEPNPRLGIPDRSVSLPLKPSVTAPKKYQYAAYGEKPKTETAPAKIDDTLFVKTTKK